MMDVPVLFLLIPRLRVYVKARKIGWKFSPLADPRLAKSWNSRLRHSASAHGRVRRDVGTGIDAYSLRQPRRPAAHKKTGRWLCRPVRIHCSDRLLRRGLD
jgi:hypothetical protein